MAQTYAGGTQVRSGYYVDTKHLSFANVEKDGGTLPGGPDARFVRVPVVVAMVAAPALGGLFVVALPFLGFGMVGYALLKKLGVGAREVAATIAAPPMPAGSTALTGQPPEAAAAGEPDAHAPTEALAKEIEAKRGAK